MRPAKRFDSMPHAEAPVLGTAARDRHGSESHLLAQGIHGLLGRDVLAECHFTYDGDAGLYTIGF